MFKVDPAPWSLPFQIFNSRMLSVLITVVYLLEICATKWTGLCSSFTSFKWILGQYLKIGMAVICFIGICCFFLSQLHHKSFSLLFSVSPAELCQNGAKLCVNMVNFMTVLHTGVT
jgi:hypothetical protein